METPTVALFSVGGLFYVSSSSNGFGGYSGSGCTTTTTFPLLMEITGPLASPFSVELGDLLGP